MNLPTITYERQNREILWKVHKSELQNKTIIDIMISKGYPTVAYGQPYSIKQEGEYFTFKCSSSSD